MKKELEQKIKVPSGVTVTVHGHVVSVSKGSVSLSKDLGSD